jgi:serine protease Do
METEKNEFEKLTEERSVKYVSAPEGDPKNATTKKNFFLVALILSIIVSASFGAFFGFLGGVLGKNASNGKISNIFSGVISNNESSKSISSDVVTQKIVQEDSAVISVVENSTPAVVSIVITRDIPRMRSFFDDSFDFPNFFFDDPNNSGGGQGGTQKQTIGGGTGFFITSDGMIVTNKHVVSDTVADYTVMTNDGKEYSAKVLARDPVQDVAVIKVEGNNFPVLNLGDSDSLKIGQTVIAIGNSLGEFSNTVSRGIISGLRRNLTAGSGFGDTEKLTNIIQTDAAINPGNSGGPLLDASGNVIGVNVAMAEGAQNIGFAIPGNQIKKIIDQVKRTGKISTPFLGVRYIPIDKTIQQENNLPYEYGILIARGTKISDLAVVPGSPADKAGIMENDIILEIDGKKLDSESSFADIIASKDVGAEISLKVWHKGNVKDTKVKLEERK